MSSSTRSGRILKHEGTSSTRSSSAAAKVKKIKDSPTSGSTATSTKNTRSSATSGSAATISSSLRKSSRETPTKKMTASSPGSRRSERLENQTPYKKAAGLDKKRSHSPLRRSQRIEKNGISSSPGSTTLDMSSSPPMKKQKLDDENLDAQSCGTSKKKKRLNARRYRALLQPKKVECSDDDSDMHIKDDHAPKGNSSNSASSNSKKVHEGLDESNRRKEDKFQGKYSADNSKDAADGSSSSSRELAGLTTDNDRLRKSACLSGRKESEDKSPVSKCSGNFLQSSLVGMINKNVDCVLRREIHAADDRHDTCKLDIGELEVSGLVASTSEVKSLAVDRGPECIVNSRGSKNAETAADLDSDVSVTAGKKEICIPVISKADVTSPSPCETTSIDIKRCTVCHKHERVHNESEAHESCVCDSQRENDFVSSVIEETSELVSNPCEIDASATCHQSNNVEGNPMPEAREHSPGSEKQNHLVTSPNKGIVSGPTNEDRGTFISDGTCTSEEHLRFAHLKESLVAVQTDSGTNACVVCKHPGQLLCCDGKGCKRSYHLPCLNPPLQDTPPGVWLCHLCVRKKVESGVHSVSEGIESIWDVKEGMQNGKHYFVKYKGLAHVHNEWVSESRILLEAPMVVAKFGRRHQKEKGSRWKQDWTEPHRLLQKRQLLPKNLVDEYLSKHGDKFSYCYHEWLVKWKGLGYEHATWELENSQPLCSPVARALMSDFESRHEEAKNRSHPLQVDKTLQVKKSPIHKLTRFPDDCSATLDNDHLNSVNRLREFWHKSQNAVFIDDQERIVKSVLFVSALKSHICQPILVISTVHSLSLWETEFSRLAPSINVVVYTGTKGIRKLIRSLEFYEEGGCVMFQVLLSQPDVIIEDFDALDCIGWEALIIDECQNPRVSKHLEQFKGLSTEFKLLLLSAQLKDSVADYLNLLSFLKSGGKENGSSSSKSGTNNAAGALAILKEKLRHYLAYERKLGSSKFLEYWVPVQLSNVQLEQYCSTLVSNLSTLRSSSKVDHVGALRDILISTRKCCDHPYLVGRSLQSSLIKVLPSEKLLDIGVKASGKLHLLDKFLHEIKNQGLRVLILFQSIGGAGKDSIGDILDDFIRQRFGPDSYERVDSGLIMSKKLSALSKFNDKAKGRFVFLIENRACLPSIKLSSVDAVVIFNSDWNPFNDLRALQRIHFESQFEHVKVFRLYSSCTVEEKVLIFAKQDMILDSNIQSISPINSHLLLSWGAFHLFNELEKFHQHYTVYDYSENSIDKCFLNDSMLKFLNDVMVELVKELPGKAENNFCECLLLITAQQSGASYSRNISLVGERDGITSLDKDPPSFWLTLLEKKYPKWRFISETSQRIRRKVQNFEESLKGSEVENDEVRKKRRKLTTNTVDPICLQTWLEDKTKGLNKESKVHDDISHSFSQPPSVSSATMSSFPVSMTQEPDQIKFAETYGSQSNVGSQCMTITAGIMNHVNHNLQASSISDDAAELHKFSMSDSEGRRNAQKTLHLCLKPELFELCDTLKLPDDVKGLAHMLLEYIMNNHHVSREPETILQAFKLSLCWRAASFLKHKVDHKECLALAKKYLNYTCNEEQADSVYSKLRMLKKKFSQSSEFRHEDEANSVENQSSSSRMTDVSQQMHGGTSESASSFIPELGDIIKVSDRHRSSGQPVLEQEKVPDAQSSKIQQNLCSLKDVLLQKRVDLIDIVCSKREDAIVLKQQEELSDFNVHREEEKLRLKDAHNDQLELIRSIHTDYTIRTDKVKLLNQEFFKKMAEYDRHMQCQRRRLAAMQEDVKKKEQDIRNSWIEEAKAGTLAESFDTLPLTESGFRLEEFKEITVLVEACDGSSLMSVSRSATECVRGDIITTVPEVPIGITENNIENRSTFSSGTVEDVQHFASNSSKMAELEPPKPIGTSAETLGSVLPNRVEVEFIDSNRTSNKIPGPASDLMRSDAITTVPQMFTGTTENHRDMSSSFSIRKGEDLHGPASQSSNFAEIEPVQPKTTSSEMPEVVFPGMVEVEAVEPTDTSAVVPEAILPDGDGDMSKDSGIPFSDSEVMNELGNQLNTMHMVPLQANRITTEIPETVPSTMVEVESSEPAEISSEIPATVMPAQDFAISEDSGTPFSESNVISVLGNPSETLLMVPSISKTSLPQETRTPVFESNVMVEEGSLEANRTSAGVRATISSPEIGDICREAEAPPSQMMDTGSDGTHETLTGSTVAAAAAAAAETNIHRTEDNSHGTCLVSSPLQNPAELSSKINKPQDIHHSTAAAAAIDRDVIEGEVNSDGTDLRLSPLQNPVNLPTISRGSTNSYCEKSVSSNLVSSLTEHVRLAVSVGADCEEGLASPNITPVSFDVVTSQVGPTASHADTSNSALFQVPPVENLSTENGQESTPRSLRSGGGIHTEGTHSSQPTALSMQQPNMSAEMLAEEFNQLACQSVLHPAPPAETVGTERELTPESCCLASQTEVPVQQPIASAAMQADQSNQLVSQSVLHPPLPLTNLLPERTHSEGNGSGVPQEPGIRLLQILPMAAWVHPQALHPDPLQNELMRIRKQVELRTKMHEDKKLQLKLECEQEIERVRKKFDGLVKDDEVGFHQDKKILETIYNKVLVNQILAAEFRAKFIDTKGGASTSFQGHSSNSTQQFLQTSQALHTSPRLPSATGSAHVPVIANLPPVAMPARASSTLPSAASRPQVPAGSSVTPGLMVRHRPSVIPTSNVRSQFNPMLPAHPNLQGVTDVRAPASRAPAPHLQRFRPHTSMMAPILPPRSSQLPSQQHPHSTLGSPILAAAAPPVHLPRGPLGRTFQPVASGPLPHSHVKPLPSVELLRDLGSANAKLPNLPQSEVRPSPEGQLSSNIPVNSSASAPSTMAATRPTSSAADLVCLSDDE